MIAGINHLPAYNFTNSLQTDLLKEITDEL